MPCTTSATRALRSAVYKNNRLHGRSVYLIHARMQIYGIDKCMRKWHEVLIPSVLTSCVPPSSILLARCLKSYISPDTATRIKTRSILIVGLTGSGKSSIIKAPCNHHDKRGSEEDERHEKHLNSRFASRRLKNECSVYDGPETSTYFQ